MGLSSSFALEGSINSIKINVSHSHANYHDDHHHDDVQEESQNTKHSEDSENNKKHSHELLISASQTFFVEANIDIQIKQISNNHFSEPSENSKPRSGYFGSIFRPPIQA